MLVRLQCPSCERKSRALDVSTIATEVRRFTCSACHETWQAVIAPRPVTVPGVRVHVATLSFIGRVERRLETR